MNIEIKQAVCVKCFLDNDDNQPKRCVVTEDEPSFLGFGVNFSDDDKVTLCGNTSLCFRHFQGVAKEIANAFENCYAEPH